MDTSFEFQLSLTEGYQFTVDYGVALAPSARTLITDEPEPLGKNSGPNPTRLLATGVANCLAASLLFALRKFKDEPTGLVAKVNGELGRQAGRWRIIGLHVELALAHDETQLPHMRQALAQFEEFCVVTQSVRQGIPVQVSVVDSHGQILHEGG